MIDSLFDLIVLIVSGFGSGIFVGLGSGNTGSIMVTSLTVFLDQPIYQAIGTSLLIDCIIGGIAGLIFLKKGNSNFKPAILVAFTGCIGSFIGSQFTSKAPEVGLIIFLSAILIGLGLSFIVKGVQDNIDYIKKKGRIDSWKKNKILLLIILGFASGVGSGFTGMGNGGILALIFMLLLDYDLHTAIGTALLCVMFVSGAGSVGHMLNNEVLFNSSFIAGCAAIVGAVIGAFYANRINENILGRVVGVLILFLGVILLIRAF